MHVQARKYCPGIILLQRARDKKQICVVASALRPIPLIRSFLSVSGFMRFLSLLPSSLSLSLPGEREKEREKHLHGG